MTKMQLSIPNDWDNETWECYQITFPKSDDWIGLFLGSLSQWYKGRLWDKKTGNIKATQLIGRDIWERNYPLKICSEVIHDSKLEFLNFILDCLGLAMVDELPETCEEVTQIFASEDCNCEEEESEDCMASVTNLKCENGKLYMERCCQWFEVCDLSTLLGQTQPPDAETEFTQCTFSGGYALAIYSAIAGLENYMYSVNAQTAQVMTDMTRQAYAALFLDSWLLFQASEIYKANLAVIHAEIPEELSVDVIRCIVYDLMTGSDNFSPDPANVSVANQFYLQVATLQQPTRDYLAKLIASINLAYLGSVIGNYRDSVFDCDCGQSELSPESPHHGVNGWYLSEGYAGSVQSSGGNNIWPVCQFCLENPIDTGKGYGLAFDIVSMSASGVVNFNNPTFPQQCTSQLEISPDVGHSGTVFVVGQYIICHSDVYGFLEADGLIYTLVQNNTYGNAPNEGHWDNEDIAKLSFRNTVNNTPFQMYVTNLRIVKCAGDA